MDSKIKFILFFLVIYFIPAYLNAIEFKGKFLQGHYIIGLTDPSAKIVIDKKEVIILKKYMDFEKKKLLLLKSFM